MQQEKNYRKPFDFINSALFTQNDIPLALDDTEKLIYFNPFANFHLTLGSGVPAYTSRYNSQKGTVYITSHRLIYRPKTPSRHFDNFNISLHDVIRVEDFFVEIKVENEAFKACINFEESQICFYSILEEAVKRVGKRVAQRDNFKDPLPLYSDVIKKDKNKDK